MITSIFTNMSSFICTLSYIILIGLFYKFYSFLPEQDTTVAIDDKEEAYILKSRIPTPTPTSVQQNA